MQRLLYYPNFEIQNEDFLKFALIYIDEIQPIIPYRAYDELSDTMQDILRDTDLIMPYNPSQDNGELASALAIRYLEDYFKFDDPMYNLGTGRRIDKENRNYTLYYDKYAPKFENYCLENKLGERCDEGIRINQGIAYIYMSILADIISKENEIDMITDDSHYADYWLRGNGIRNRKLDQTINKAKSTIECQIPVDMRNIPVSQFIKLRSAREFEEARRSFVRELNSILNMKDNGIELSRVNLADYWECKRDLVRLLEILGTSFAAIAVGVHAFGDMRMDESTFINYFGNFGNIALSLETLKDQSTHMKKYIESFNGKRLARKYLAKLKNMGLEVL